MSKLKKELTFTNPYVFPYNENGEVVSKVKISSETVEVGARLMSTKVVPLIVDVVGEELPELQITSIELPKKIKIRGDFEDLEQVEEILAKEIDLSNYTASAEIPIEVFLPNGIEIADASKDLVAKLSIKGLSSKSFEYNTSVIKPLGLSENYAVEIVPSNLIVSVADRDSVLEGITSTDIDININLEGLGLGTHQVEVTASIDGKTDNINIGPNLVTVNIHALQ